MCNKQTQSNIFEHYRQHMCDKKREKSQKCIPNGLYIRPQMCTHHFRALVLFMGLFNNLQTHAIGREQFFRCVISFGSIGCCNNKFGYLRKLLHCAGSWLNNFKLSDQKGFFCSRIFNCLWLLKIKKFEQ